ncbi:MAG: hypothetical protein KDA45_07340 [Planctomycetales bacterium]|nr:hypothetical protein [Planctomycetales bacterium]
MMQPTTQPILCCLGDKVAGQPTQFMLERAIAATQLDWRVITVEVAQDDLPAAITGMRVMRFSAARFFPALQPLALTLLAADDAWLQFIGGVTSATLTDSVWQPWHHEGAAIRQWAGGQVDFSKTLCWLHGDSLRCRSFLAALPDSPLPQAIVWSTPAADIPPSLQRIAVGNASRVVECLTADALSRVKELLSAADGPNSVLLVGDDSLVDVAPRPLPDALPQQSLMPRWLLVGGKALSQRFARWELPVEAHLRDGELTVACEAYDFRRWTAHAVETGILRDAYDEFCAF